ncbi:MAG: type II 3-dehydroquinate dehydratase [Bacteroidaceae bacterium]|nr:type II 3-dehydroquinate dehydratase [Bacteroidaceae bacterium]
MKVLVINGPNLNMLGVRNPKVYGTATYAELVDYIERKAKDLCIDVRVIQSNSEGDLVTAIQQAYKVYDGIVLNAAAYTHTSVAILDALEAVSIPTVEVHLSDIARREEFRHHSFVSLYAFKTIKGFGFEGYAMALEELIKHNNL